MVDDFEDKKKTGENEEELENIGICHPAHLVHRYFFMVFMCSLGIGNYFCYDAPGALQDETKADMNIKTPQFTLLYALYNWPNMLLSLLGGFLVDRFFGIKLGAIIFACFTFSGQFLLGVGAYMDAFWLMGVGRFVFAIGGENLAVCANMRAVKWFKGRELNMVFGLQLSIARAGSTINLNAMKPIYDWVGGSTSGYKQLGIAFMIASVVAAYDLITAILLAIRDSRAERLLKTEDVKADKINVRDIKEFKLDFWMISLIIVFYYVAIFPFVSLGIPFFRHKFGFTSAEASRVDSVVYLISMILSPFLGIFVGRLGRNLIFVLLAVMTSLVAHAMLTFTSWTPWLAMSVLGVGYSFLACTLWPMISLCVAEKYLGTAYGMAQAIQNGGLGLIALAAGFIVDSKGYYLLGVFFMVWLCLAIISIMILFVYDERKGGVLNMTPSQRDVFNGKKAIAESDNSEQLGVDGAYNPKSTQL